MAVTTKKLAKLASCHLVHSCGIYDCLSCCFDWARSHHQHISNKKILKKVVCELDCHFRVTYQEVYFKVSYENMIISRQDQNMNRNPLMCLTFLTNLVFKNSHKARLKCLLLDSFLLLYYNTEQIQLIQTHRHAQTYLEV